ncbi:MAG: nitroreductase [Desulfobacterales bacterium GWB2_56_26]|nr:MAG: nitroreductase [Desulfobacterales bacterium GWB2_56_26]
MNIIDALLQRKSARAFLDKPVDREKIERILRAARHAPSGTNAQPWQVAVVSGKKKEELTRILSEAFQQNGPGVMDYQYYPIDWHEPYKSRRVACGAQLYTALGIDRRDKERRLAQWAANYRAFGAPVILFFFLDPVMQKGSFLDYGMFLQSVMLAAQEEGLATCAQAALGQYPQLIKDFLGYSRDTTLICGMALGYEDKEAPVNHYRTPREEVVVFTRFFE